MQQHPPKARKSNGAGFGAVSHEPYEEEKWSAPSAPAVIADAAENCIQHVERALGIRLDYQPETLPLLDHYLETSRPLVQGKPEVLALLAQTAGAYFGEVVRRRYPSWWRIEGDDPSEFRIEFENVFLAVNPVRIIVAALIYDALRALPSSPKESIDSSDTDLAQLILDEDERDAVIARLAELPPVSEQEYYAPSTRLEVIDIVVDALRGRRMADGEGEQSEIRLSKDDYDH